MLVEEPLSLLSVEFNNQTLTKFFKVRTSGSHFLFKETILTYNSESDRSGNPAMRHLSFYDCFRIYEKSEMLRCRLERRARFFFAEAKKNSPFSPPSSVL